MKYSLIKTLGLAIFVLTSSLLFAQNVENAVTCSGEWQSIKAKVPSSKVALGLSTTKEGQKLLQWSAHKLDLVTKLICKAKGPINAKGEIEICNVAVRVCTFTDSNSISLRELRETGKLLPGYYAMRVIIGGNDYVDGDTSDWITIQIE
jgi:hypothetical protein